MKHGQLSAVIVVMGYSPVLPLHTPPPPLLSLSVLSLGQCATLNQHKLLYDCVNLGAQ